MSEDKPTTLDSFRVMAGVGRVVLNMVAYSDGGAFQVVKVGMTADEARELASDLIARAERVEGERR